MTNILTPLTSELGIGSISGFCVGYSLKKMAKIVTGILSLCFIGLQYLAYNKIIEINYGAVEGFILDIIGETSAFQHSLMVYMTQMSYYVGFASGLALGIKKG